MEYHDIFDCNIYDHFEKKFTFDRQKDWIVPSSVLKEDSLWQLKSLKALKHDLNDTKSLLNDKGEDWHEHTAKINKASFIIDTIKKRIQPEILTQAWCKFYEILSNFCLIANNEHLRSLHLCEAPGAFISALNYYLWNNHLQIEWNWMANTLNPYYEGHNIRNVVVDDRLLFPTIKNWFFGQDNTGDITDPSFIEDLCNTVTGIGLFDLITADGSVDCLDNPGEQELVVEKLHFAEVLIALTCLSTQGCFVLKKFTFFECSSICQLYLLNCVFEKVHVFKPFTSRSSNSEVYVICIGFQGSEHLSNILKQCKDLYSTKNAAAIFPKSSIPESFLQQLEDCMKHFTSLQTKAIKENLNLYKNEKNLITEKLNDLKKVCANIFLEKCPINYSPSYDDYKLYIPKKKILASFSDGTYTNPKILYFQAVGDTFENIAKSSCMSWYSKLLDVEKRMNVCFPVNRKRPIQTVEWHFPSKEVKKRTNCKNFQNWIILGKEVTCIQNSKFCYPALLHLWNRISLDTKVHVQPYYKDEYSWNKDMLEDILKPELPISEEIVIVSVSQKSSMNDCFLLYLKENFGFKVNYCFEIDVNSEIKTALANKTVYMNTTMWINSLHNECLIKKYFTDGVFFTLKSLNEGDSLILCIQSLLTRYTVGVVFLILSLFEKFTTFLPEDSASASCGQIWIFNNYLINKKTTNILQHLKNITELNSSEGKHVLEIVPLTSLCDGAFYNYVRNLNNKHLLQRLKSLIAVEKHKFEKSA